MVGPLTEFETLLALAVFVAVAFVAQRGPRRKVLRFFRRTMRNFRRSVVSMAKTLRERIAEFQAGHVVARIRTIDGDTIEDRDSGVRYRVANIDCPETDDRAGCYRERVKGEQAKGAAETILSTAKRVEVRPVGRIDRHGRTVAYVRVDAQDFGRLMIDKGYAVAWTGVRGRWCGEDGGLAELARRTSAKHACRACGAGQTSKFDAAQNASGKTVIPFPVKGSHTDKPDI